MFAYDETSQTSPALRSASGARPDPRADGPSGASAATSADPELGGLSDDDLERALCSHAAHIAVAECRFVLMVAEVDRRGIWADQGARSCAHWLSWRCGLTEPVGREHARVGRALACLPHLRGAFSRGEISYSKVRALTRIATPEMDEALLDMAAYATASQLEVIVRAYRRASHDEGEIALERHRRRYLHSFTDDEGMVVIRARLSPEDGAAVLAAIESTREILARDAPDVPAETPDQPFAASSADALVAICEAANTHGVRIPSAFGPRASVVVHVDRQVLVDPAQEGCAHVEGGGAVSVHTVQRLVCDGSVSAVSFERGGTVVPEGRTRQIPLRMRRAVLTRDGGCRWPGCSSRRYVDVHHVVFVSNGGKTRPTNLVTLCRTHHRCVHEGGYSVRLVGGDTVRVTAPDGEDLSALQRLPGAQGPGLAAQHRRRGLHLHDRTMPVGGEPFTLADTVDWLLVAAAGSAPAGSAAA